MPLVSSWANAAHVLVTGILAYAALVAFLRVTGKRTLAKLNAFDLVVTVALGSTLASAILPANAALLDGLLALAVLIGAQYVVAWLQVRVGLVRRLVKSDPALLFYRGGWLPDALRRERVTEDEVVAAMRSEGIRDVDDVDAVVLETDGTLSVIPRAAQARAASTLARVGRPAGARREEAARP